MMLVNTALTMGSVPAAAPEGPPLPLPLPSARDAVDLKNKKKGPRESRAPRVITGTSAASWCHRAPILLRQYNAGRPHLQRPSRHCLMNFHVAPGAAGAANEWLVLACPRSLECLASPWASRHSGPAAALELGEQTQNFQVQPDECHEQPERPVPLHIPGRAALHAALDEVEVEHQVEGRDHHDDETDADREWARVVEEGHLHAEEAKDEARQVHDGDPARG